MWPWQGLSRTIVRTLLLPAAVWCGDRFWPTCCGQAGRLRAFTPPCRKLRSKDRGSERSWEAVGHPQRADQVAHCWGRSRSGHGQAQAQTCLYSRQHTHWRQVLHQQDVVQQW